MESRFLMTTTEADKDMDSARAHPSRALHGAHTEAGGSGAMSDRYDEAKKIVIRDQNASTSYVQRKLQCGYNEASRYVEMMQAAGIVSEPEAMPGYVYPHFKRKVLVQS
jgi:DNA segregation ATPase FtsK/SpoIIIE-like protein